MTTISDLLALPEQGLLFDLEELYQGLQMVPDRRKRRGRRYPLAALLMIGCWPNWPAKRVAGLWHSGPDCGSRN
jgi:hypothetical protein